VGISINKKSFNNITLSIFAPLLILVGVAGFVIPVQHSLTSGAVAYNVFHISFGFIGLLVLWSRQEWLVIGFNIGFGLIDLYQALASYWHLPPERYFLWTRTDDTLHIVIGLLLVMIGAYGRFKLRRV
jgi:hydrogenase-4 membrane subunit HyfE